MTGALPTRGAVRQTTTSCWRSSTEAGLKSIAIRATNYGRHALKPLLRTYKGMTPRSEHFATLAQKASASFTTCPLQHQTIHPSLNRHAE